MAMTAPVGTARATPTRAELSSLRLLLSLTKPRVTALVLFTFAFGAVMAPGVAMTASLLSAAVGTALVVGAANVLNMWWERDTDALMARTRDRPLASGRLSPRAALAFGLGLLGVSLPLLAAANLLVCGMGLAAFAIYVFLYTPLKRRTWHSLSIGAIAGAAPPLMGWTAVTGALGAKAGVLFAILLIWQLPHSTAISLFRAEEYASAGLRVCAVDLGPAVAKRVTVVTSLMLVAISWVPYRVHLGGPVYATVAAALGIAFLALQLGDHGSSARWGRRVFAGSIVYQVLLFAALWLDRV